MYAELEPGLGYSFRDNKLLENALTHSSFANEHRDGRTSNERLEFLGDSILGYVVAQRLYHDYPELYQQDFSWDVPAGRYMDLFHRMLNQ